MKIHFLLETLKVVANASISYYLSEPYLRTIVNSAYKSSAFI